MHDPQLLRAEMERNDLSIMEVTRRSGVTRPTVQRALKGKEITLRSLEKIARTMGRSAAFFLLPLSSEFTTASTAAS